MKMKIHVVERIKLNVKVLSMSCRRGGELVLYRRVANGHRKITYVKIGSKENLDAVINCLLKTDSQNGSMVNICSKVHLMER